MVRIPTEIRFAEFDQPLTASGSWAGNTPILMGYLVGIRVRPLTASTRYDFKITDKDGYVPLERKTLTGTMQLYIANGPIPIRSIVTAAIDNASVDETFDVDLIMDP